MSELTGEQLMELQDWVSEQYALFAKMASMENKPKYETLMLYSALVCANALLVSMHREGKRSISVGDLGTFLGNVGVMVEDIVKEGNLTSAEDKIGSAAKH